MPQIDLHRLGIIALAGLAILVGAIPVIAHNSPLQWITIQPNTYPATITAVAQTITKEQTQTAVAIAHLPVLSASLQTTGGPTPIPTSTSSNTATPSTSLPPTTNNPNKEGDMSVFAQNQSAASLSACQAEHLSASVPSGSNLMPVCVTFYNGGGIMADGNEAHVGACAVWAQLIPFGTTFNLYPSTDTGSGKPYYSCTAEDVFGGSGGQSFCQNHIDVYNPDGTQDIQFGVQEMYLQVTGMDQAVAAKAKSNNPSSPGCGLSW